ncbi:fungal-specific transcription factor domain-containing protein [Diplogelasinospora grovesii]|uniref:Fungal-specific transcription factor domain-containing protein n=1 Tax=Diplogelasinospora grovesii TaxID=303347 RepID=A0AAN6RYW6_9PEZI|nr:fungal-specific transcription factor domain-containing protein [Diplogelasinospora grovesii]
MAEVSAAAPPKRRVRRIPDATRKRSAHSCDFCRKRRSKCVPLPSGHGCVMCQDHNLECSYKLPRKTRFYGSVDDLSDRYKCLEAIVRGAFPNDGISTVPELIRLGEHMGYAMPDLSQKSGESPRIEELVRDFSTEAGDQGLAEATEGASPPPPRTGAVNVHTENERRHCSSQVQENNSCADEPVGLIRDTTGREHFIGPSGSLQFLGQLRRLLLVSRSEDAAGARPPARLTATFTDEDAAQALEADGDQSELPGLPSGGTGNSANEGQEVDERSPASLGSALVRDFASIPVNDIDEIRRQLPPRHVLDSLVRLYFKNDHADFPLFHRGTFEEEYETFMSMGRYYHQHARAGVHLSSPTSPEPGWLGCLHMMIAFASLSGSVDVTPDLDLTSLCRHCANLTRQLLPQFVSKCTLSNVRALLLLSLFLHNHNERNAAWNLVGTAMRLSFALGLHRASDNGSHFRPVEREVRKRVFCTLYGFEQFLASSLGRPSGFYDFEDVEIVPPREGVLDSGQDEDDEAMKLSLRLQVILAKARVSLAVKTLAVVNDRSNTDGLARQEQSSRETLGILKAWRDDLAAHHMLNIPFIGDTDDPLCQDAEEVSRMPLQDLKAMMSWQSRPRLRAALVLHLQYRYVAVLVTRSALLRYVASAQRDGRDHTAPPSRNDASTDLHNGSAGERLSDICVTHAVQLCRLILIADSFGLVNGISAMDVFYAYCGVMVLILRSLRISSSASGYHDQREARLQLELRKLIAQTREVLMRVNKCSTMKRFARVVATFEDGSRQDNGKPADGAANRSTGNSALVEMGTTRQTSRGARGRYNNSIHSALDGRRASNLAIFPGAGASLDTSSSLSGSQQEPLTFQHGHGAGIVPRLGMSDPFWQPNLLTSLDGEPEANDWMMDPFLAMDGPGVVDWGDIESLLSRNPGQ